MQHHFKGWIIYNKLICCEGYLQFWGFQECNIDLLGQEGNKIIIAREEEKKTT